MISDLHPAVVVLTRKGSASPSELRAVTQRFPTMPPQLLEWFRDAAELELSYKGRYLRLYGARGSIEMDEAYGVSQRLPGAVTLGDNGGGEAVIYLPSPKPGIYRVGYGSLATDEVTFIAQSIEALLVRAEPMADLIGGVEAQPSVPADVPASPSGRQGRG